MSHRCLGLVLLALAASAQANDFSRHAGRAFGATAGIATSIYVHELGHAAALKLQGATDIRIQVPGEQCRLLCGATHARFSQPPSAQSQRWNAAAGLLASNLVSEALMDRRAWATSGIGQGFIAANLYANIAHVYTYYTRHVGVDGYRGNDIDAFEAAGGNPHVLSAALVGYSLYAVKRMRDRHIPLMFVQLRF